MTLDHTGAPHIMQGIAPGKTFTLSSCPGGHGKGRPCTPNLTAVILPSGCIDVTRLEANGEETSLHIDGNEAAFIAQEWLRLRFSTTTDDEPEGKSEEEAG